MKIISFLLLALILPACATSKSPLRPKDGLYEKETKALEGISLKDLVKRLGYPDRTLKSPDGNEVYEYSKNSGTEVTSETSGAGYTIQSGPAAGLGSSSSTSTSKLSNLSCVTWVEIKDGKVLGVSWKGNHCVGYETAVACSGYVEKINTYDVYPSAVCNDPKKVLRYYFEGETATKKVLEFIDLKKKAEKSHLTGPNS